MKKNRAWVSLLQQVRGNAPRLLGAAFATLLSVALQFMMPLLLAEVMDSVIGDKASTLPAWLLQPIRSWGGRDDLRAHLWLPALLLVLLYVLGGMFSYFKGRWTAEASESIAMNLRERLFAHLQKLPFAYHVHAETGDLIQRSTSDVDTVRRFLSIQLMEVVNALTMLTLALIVLLNRHVQLTLYSMMLIPPLFLFAMWYSRGVHRDFEKADEAEGRMSTVLQENLSGVRVVRAFAQQQREVEQFERVNKDYEQKSLRIGRLMAFFWSGGDFVSMLQVMISLIVCVFFASRGEITVGTSVLFISYLHELLYPVREMGRTLAEAGKSLIAMGRIQEILDTPIEPDEPDALKPDLHGDIVFDHVGFAFPDDAKPVLHDLSCTIPAGRTTAILGTTGSGKSTMMALLQRLYEPTEGRITIGGIDIRRIDREHLRRHVGLILQEPFLYSKTIEDNIGIVYADQQHEAVRRAAAIAHASAFIAQSEKGYDTIVGEKGVTLSGGQKQRIAIARTLLKDNAILIFDDSLSAVDTETDAAIRASLRKEQRAVTTLIISHRMTTLRQADQILVLQNGRIVQQGTHDQLVCEPGLYSRIERIQSRTDLEQEG